MKLHVGFSRRTVTRDWIMERGHIKVADERLFLQCSFRQLLAGLEGLLGTVRTEHSPLGHWLDWYLRPCELCLNINGDPLGTFGPLYIMSFEMFGHLPKGSPRSAGRLPRGSFFMLEHSLKGLHAVQTFVLANYVATGNCCGRKRNISTRYRSISQHK